MKKIVLFVLGVVDAAFWKRFSFSSKIDDLLEVDDGWACLLHCPHDESFESYFGLDMEEERFDPFDQDLFPSPSNARKHRLENFYSRIDSFCKPESKADWLFVMQHFSRLWDERDRKPFELKDIYNLKRMKELTVTVSEDLVTVHEVYLEGLCNIAQVDSDALTILNSILKSLEGKMVHIIAGPCFPGCLLRTLKPEMVESGNVELFISGLSDPLVTEEDLSLIPIEEIDAYENIILLGTAFHNNRLCAFKQLVSVLCNMLRTIAEDWSKFKQVLNSIFSQLSGSDRKRFIPFNNCQIEMTNILLVELGTFALKQLDRFMWHLNPPNFNLQIKCQFFDIFPETVFEAESDDSFSFDGREVISGDKSVYLESLCQVAENDAGAAKAFDLFIEYLPGKAVSLESSPSFFPACLFTKLKSFLTEQNINELLRNAICNPKLTDEEIVSLAEDAFGNANFVTLVNFLELAFKNDRPYLFQTLAIIVSVTLDPYADSLAKMKGALNYIFFELPIHNHGHFRRFNQLQVRMLDFLLGKLGETNLVALFRHVDYLDESNDDPQIKSQLTHFLRRLRSEYFDDQNDPSNADDERSDSEEIV